MKTAYKICRQVAYTLVAIGLVLVIVGRVMGASWQEASVNLVVPGNHRWNRWADNKHTPQIAATVPPLPDLPDVPAIPAIPELPKNSTRQNNHGTIHSGEIILNESYSDVSELYFDFESAEVEVIEGDTFSVSVSGEGDGFTTEVSGGVWNIKSLGDTNHWGGNRHGRNKHYNVVITLPRSFVASSVYIDMGMGSINVDRLTTSKSELNVGMGEIEIDNLTSQETVISCGMGSISIDGSLTGTTTIDCGMGSVELDLAGREDSYGYSSSVGMGTITIGDKVSLGGIAGDSASDLDRANQLVIDCGMGSVDIGFED